VLDSVREHGLGGFNLLAQLRTREAFAHLDEFLQSRGSELEGFDQLTREHIREGHSRYQFGDLYAASSLKRASGYAGRDGGIGEFGGFLIRMLAAARARGYEPCVQSFPVFGAYNHNARPIVLEFPCPELRYLAYESGRPITADFVKHFECVRGFIGDESPEPFLRVHAVIPWSVIRVITADQFELGEPEYGGADRWT
jgi:hypothetical protein